MLHRAVKNQRFRSANWAIAYCKETKQKYRINGKHTSTMFSGMNGEFPKGLYVVLEEFECDTLLDVADVYCTYDQKKSARTNGDINRIFAAVEPDFDDVPARSINAIISGISYALWEDSYYSQDAESRAQLILTNKEFALFVHSILSDGEAKDAKRCARSPVIAAMFLSWKKSKTDAAKFWAAVRDGTGAKPEDADRKLNKLLLTVGLRLRRTDIPSMGHREMLVKCIHAWNAWRKGETTDMRFHADKPTPACK